MNSSFENMYPKMHTQEDFDSLDLSSEENISSWLCKNSLLGKYCKGANDAKWLAAIIHHKFKETEYKHQKSVFFVHDEKVYKIDCNVKIQKAVWNMKVKEGSEWCNLQIPAPEDGYSTIRSALRDWGIIERAEDSGPKLYYNVEELMEKHLELFL